uniref:Uncharacterized protein n=1 Tax=Anguilla anguilla TaxID=7936 RepID=A0A0E9XJ72_ANGAN
MLSLCPSDQTGQSNTDAIRLQ